MVERMKAPGSKEMLDTLAEYMKLPGVISLTRIDERVPPELVSVSVPHEKMPDIQVSLPVTPLHVWRPPP